MILKIGIAHLLFQKSTSAIMQLARMSLKKIGNVPKCAEVADI